MKWNIRVSIQFFLRLHPSAGVDCLNIMVVCPVVVRGLEELPPRGSAREHLGSSVLRAPEAYLKTGLSRSPWSLEDPLEIMI